MGMGGKRNDKGKREYFDVRERGKAGSIECLVIMQSKMERCTGEG